MLIRLSVVLLCLVAVVGCKHFQMKTEEAPRSDVASWETPPAPPSSGPSEDELAAIREQNEELKGRVAALRERVDEMKEADAPAPAAEPVPEITGTCPACIDQERVTNALRSAGITDLEVSTTAAGETCIILSGKISFGAGRADLMKGAQGRLTALDRVLRGLCPGIGLRVDGHTDSDPIRKSKWSGNQELSEARAAAVAGYFVSSLGWKASSVSTRGYGAERPLVANSTREGKARNRRVEIVLVH